MSRVRVALAIAAITLLSFFVFPGHTYLQQDTQIYVPILECQLHGCGAEYSGDLVTARPHVNFTLYDELTVSLARLTGAPVQPVLEGEQLVFRSLGFWGIYLIALALGEDSAGAIVVTAICSLGAVVAGPAVLTIEYEPTPRAFAVPLLFLSIGWLLRGRPWWSGVAAGSAILLHAPTTLPVLLVFGAGSVFQRRFRAAWIPTALAAAILAAVGLSQPTPEHQRFLAQLAPQLESLQRLRAPYNYVSTWWLDNLPEYFVFAGISWLALARLEAGRDRWIVLGGLSLAGLLSVPASFLFLEGLKLALIPQVQPARALLFVIAIAALTSATAGCRALRERRFVQAGAWFIAALALPAITHSAPPAVRSTVTLIALASLMALSRFQWRIAAATLLAPALAFAAGIRNYQNIETPQLADLARWAAARPVALYVFPDAARDRSPGWFRAAARRPVYVDWKGGGQLNYLPGFGDEWSRRWFQVMNQPVDFSLYRSLHIDFAVLKHSCNCSRPSVYHNAIWHVYEVAGSRDLVNKN